MCNLICCNWLLFWNFLEKCRTVFVVSIWGCKAFLRRATSDFVLFIQAWMGINLHWGGILHVIFNWFSSGVWWIPHLIEIDLVKVEALQKSICLRGKRLNVTNINCTLTVFFLCTSYYLSHHKVQQESFSVLIIFYVRTFWYVALKSAHYPYTNTLMACP